MPAQQLSRCLAQADLICYPFAAKSTIAHAAFEITKIAKIQFEISERHVQITSVPLIEIHTQASTPILLVPIA